MTAEYQLSLDLVDPDNTNERAKGLLGDAKSNLGFVPNMYAGMANAPGLLDTTCTVTSYSARKAASNRRSRKWCS